MKTKILILFVSTIFITFSSFSQQKTSDLNQNPNFAKSMNSYLETNKEIILTQGTTSQETYKAIDPLQERRDLRSLRRKHRANRLLWRHQERLERAKNTQFIEYDYPNYYNGYYNNNWNNFGSLLSLGLFYNHFF
ncbi:hypothetical protein [Polaribacter cellanae]|uniref:Uncharacterized protein n=1 Tax=Polaribacter cellanae TaxID=2818493 RepID=A0A975CML4_9FLAO|nr:hypothetical protein [Polaribacter cellanae]QTE22000.1 hypothetical protein J3359_14450 [Polaribacter cellanae]